MKTDDNIRIIEMGGMTFIMPKCSFLDDLPPQPSMSIEDTAFSFSPLEIGTRFDVAWTGTNVKEVEVTEEISHQDGIFEYRVKHIMKP